MCTHTHVHLFLFTEVVTQIAFSQDCKYLYTVSGDSCIFVWRLSREITQVGVLYVHVHMWQLPRKSQG